MSSENISKIELFVFDVDGVLTDGSININDDGSETKAFNVRDGFGFRLWLNAGFKIAIITGRSGEALKHRMRSLGIDENLIIQGSTNKSVALDDLIEETGISASSIAYMGDDWPDLPAITRAGFSVCPNDAELEVQNACDFVTTRNGGRGAAREAIAHVLNIKGLYTP
ncbi:MAG: HAD hydrolase family protein [Phycisphaerales bacterium]|nr:HAD hydrolase family protein [Phycisphaerales bacterium]